MTPFLSLNKMDMNYVNRCLGKPHAHPPVLLLALRVSNLGSSEEELEAPEEVDQARLKYLQKWTEKRLDTVVISLPDRGPYSLLRERCFHINIFFTFYSLMDHN